MNEYNSNRNWINNTPLTVADIDSLYFCLEYRSIEVNGQEIELTAKEFDILALLILNPHRVFTYEMIADIVWNEEYTDGGHERHRDGKEAAGKAGGYRAGVRYGHQGSCV